MASRTRFGAAVAVKDKTLIQKFEAGLPVAARRVYITFAKARAKMLGRTYQDVLAFLSYEFSLPETDESWKKRQDLLAELSTILENRKPLKELPNDLILKVKALLPHIVATAGAERTTLSAQGCRAMSNIAKQLQSHILPHMDNILPGIIGTCGSTKTVTQKNANDTMIHICKYAGYSPRLFYHVCAAFKDNRIPPRTFAPEWLKILVEVCKPMMDREKDGSACEKAILAGLTDGQLKVRDNSRAVFWTYHNYDARSARKIMDSLNAHAQKALQADPNNPDKSAASQAKSSAAPRPKSALASIKAQNKERLAQSQNSKPTDSLKPVAHAAPAAPALIHPEDDKLFDAPEVHKPKLMSAPARRRIVATPMQSAPAVPTINNDRPESRGRTTAPVPIPPPGKDSILHEQPKWVPQIRKDIAGNVVPPVVPKLPAAILKEMEMEKNPTLEKSAAHEEQFKGSWETERSASAMEIRPTTKLSEITPLPESLTKMVSDHLSGEGKENAMAMRVRKKRSPKHSPEKDKLASEKKTLAMAMEALRRQSLDALGYRRLKKLIEDNPGILITKQVQFEDLFHLLIDNIARLDTITESRDNRMKSFSHPCYNTHTMLICIIQLFNQYPQWPEPKSGMTLCALLIARCNFSSTYTSVLATIDDAALLLCNSTSNEDLLPSIDYVLDTLQTVEHIISANDPILTPLSTDTVFSNSLQSLASDFGPGADKPRFANRLPIVMDFGLRIINQLLHQLHDRQGTLYEIQQQRMTAYAEYLLSTYSSIIKRGVMNFCVNLHEVIPEKQFYSYFKRESDKNLIHYYVDVADSL